MTSPPVPAPAAKPPIPPQPRDPVCGMEVDVAAPPGGIAQVGRFQYAFCSDRCHARFDADPGAFLAKDPVCGMDVNRFAPRGGEHRHLDTTYYFCNARCRDRFAADPGTFLAKGPTGMEAPPPPAPAGAEVVWVCPMDPEVREKEPVPCPICGMALEPLVVGGMPLADERNPELENMTRRFWLSIVPTAIVFSLSMFDMLPGQPVAHLFGARVLAWMQLVTSAPVVLWGG